MRRRFPLTWRLLVAILITLAVPVGSLVGLSQYLDHSVHADMEQKIDTTLDMAINMEHSLLDAGLADMRSAAAATAGDPNVSAALAGGGAPLDLKRFLQIFPQADMVLVVDRTGTVIARATSDRTGDQVLLDGLVTQAMDNGEPLAYPTLIGPAELAGEGQAIHDMVDMAVVKTADSTDPRVGTRVDTALALAGVAPIRSAAGKVIGSAIAADVLNRDFRIVDEVTHWAPTGTPMNATIAMGGVRVTTNVRLRDDQGTQFDERALGTLYSDKVMQSLAATGTYRGRAPVVAQWQRTIYQALHDYQGHMIAAAYAGIPEAYFTTVSRDFTRSLQFASLTGGSVLLVAMAVALWLLRRSIVLPLRGFAAQLATGDTTLALSHPTNDEVGDLAGAMQNLLSRWQAALGEMEAAGARLSEFCIASAAVGTGLGQAAAAAAGDPAAASQMRTGAAGATAHLQRLSEAMKTVGEGVRREERSVFYIGRVAEEIATGLTESKGMVDSALQDVGQLMAAARGALRLAGEFAAGLTMLRQDLQASGHHPRGLDLLCDPSDMLGSMASLSERVAEEVRLLVLIVQENQARLAFIREEMIRVAGVVHTTSAATHEAAASAGAVIGWMEGMAGSAVAVADEALAAQTGLSELAEANQRLHALCGEIQSQAERFRKLVDDLKGTA